MGLRSRNLGLLLGGSVDGSDVFELSIVEKSTACVLVEIDKAQTGSMRYCQVDNRSF